MFSLFTCLIFLTNALFVFSQYNYCLTNFAVYENKIIRTEDSKKLGAKYISAQDVMSRIECLKLCCITNNCDVFIYEEKNPGTCYMFQCGPPDDFRCQFTTHRNYTSAVLTASKPHPPIGQLEEEIKFNQHESELARLRQPLDNIIVPPVPSTTIETPSTPSTTTVPTPPLPTVKPEVQASTKRTECSRYQFECHSTKECIAIYNVCDGIPQCSDGSDEAAELGCPTVAIPTTTPKDILSHNNLIVEVHTRAPFSRVLPQKLLSYDEQQQQQQQQLQSQIQSQQSMNSMTVPNQANIPWQNNMPIQYNKDMNYMDPNAGMIYHPGPLDYGREGERAQMPWQPHMPYQHSNFGLGADNRGFGHKGNIPMQSPDYPSIDANVNNLQAQVPYKMNIPHGNYAPIYNQHAPPVHSVNNMDVSPHQMPYNRQSEYYYDDSVHQQQSLPQRPSNLDQTIHTIETKPVVPLIKKENEVIPSPVPTIPQVLVTSPPPHTHHRKEKHNRKQLSTEIIIKESISEDYDNFYPRSAIIVFVFGLILTASLVTLLCCRLKMIRRRLRKGGKSAYAHDADFLVNGMYL